MPSTRPGADDDHVIHVLRESAHVLSLDRGLPPHIVKTDDQVGAALTAPGNLQALTATVDRSIRIRAGREWRPRPAHARYRVGESVGVVPASAKHHVPLGRKFTALKPTVPIRARTGVLRTFAVVRHIHGNGLRSRERRFESCRGHSSKT